MDLDFHSSLSLVVVAAKGISSLSLPSREGANFIVAGDGDSGHPVCLSPQGKAKRWAPGLVNFVPAVAYHFCLKLPQNYRNLGPTF